MFTKANSRLAAIAASTVMVLGSCRFGAPGVDMPGIDALSAGSEAMELYDTNGDGKVAGGELDKAPGLKAALPRIDTDGDDGASADEVAARVGVWQKMGIALMEFGFTVTLDGNPLPGATVTFVPEPFLGDELKPASCTTNARGTGTATIAKEDRPAPSSPPGMHLGIYKVKISKMNAGKETIPAKYNESTTLGQEVAQDVGEIANQRVIYALTTK